MDRSEWISRLELLHGARRAGTPLPPEDESWYLRARNQLVRTAVATQNSAVSAGEHPRAALRLERAVPVRLGGGTWSVTATATDVSTGGFCIRTDVPLERERLAWAELSLPGALVRAPVRIAGLATSDGLVRVSFAFRDPDPDAEAAIEDFALDQILPQLVFWDQVLERIEA